MCAAAAKVAILKLCCSNEARSVYLYCTFLTAAKIYNFILHNPVKYCFTLPSPSPLLAFSVYLAVGLG